MEAANWPLHYGDTDTGEPIPPGKYPHWACWGAPGRTAGEPMSPEVAHRGELTLMAAKIAEANGNEPWADFFRDETAFSLSFTAYWPYPEDRCFDRHVWRTDGGSMQARGSYHAVTHTSFALPEMSGLMKTGLVLALESTLAWWNGAFIRGDLDPNSIRSIANPSQGGLMWTELLLVGGVNRAKNAQGWLSWDNVYTEYGAAAGLAGWQHGFAVGVPFLCRMSRERTGLSEQGLADAIAVRDHLYKLVVDTLGFVWQRFGVYGFPGRTVDGRWLTKEEAWKAYRAAYGLAYELAGRLYGHDTNDEPPAFWGAHWGNLFQLLMQAVQDKYPGALRLYMLIVSSDSYRRFVDEANGFANYALFPLGCTIKDPMLGIDGTRGFPPPPDAPTEPTTPTEPVEDVAKLVHVVDEGEQAKCVKDGGRIRYGDKASGKLTAWKTCELGEVCDASNMEWGDPIVGTKKALWTLDAAAFLPYVPEAPAPAPQPAPSGDPTYDFLPTTETWTDADDNALRGAGVALQVPIGKELIRTRAYPPGAKKRTWPSGKKKALPTGTGWREIPGTRWADVISPSVGGVQTSGIEGFVSVWTGAALFLDLGLLLQGAGGLHLGNCNAQILGFDIDGLEVFELFQPPPLRWGEAGKDQVPSMELAPASHYYGAILAAKDKATGKWKLLVVHAFRPYVIDPATGAHERGPEYLRHSEIYEEGWTGWHGATDPETGDAYLHTTGMVHQLARYEVGRQRWIDHCDRKQWGTYGGALNSGWLGYHGQMKISSKRREAVLMTLEDGIFVGELDRMHGNEPYDLQKVRPSIALAGFTSGFAFEWDDEFGDWVVLDAHRNDDGTHDLNSTDLWAMDPVAFTFRRIATGGPPTHGRGAWGRFFKARGEFFFTDFVSRNWSCFKRTAK